MQALATEKRRELLESLANVDDEIADYFLNESVPSADVISVNSTGMTLCLSFAS